jgi:hypothetical protein
MEEFIAGNNFLLPIYEDKDKDKGAKVYIRRLFILLMMNCARGTPSVGIPRP